jgi:hypothetical protein
VSGAPALTGFRAIAPSLQGVSGVTWAGADDVVVTAAAVGGQRQVVEMDTDGYALRQVPLDRLRGWPVGVTAAPGQPLVAVTDQGSIWTDVEGWRLIADGRAPVHSG